jgi:hypothetical protein
MVVVWSTGKSPTAFTTRVTTARTHDAKASFTSRRWNRLRRHKVTKVILLVEFTTLKLRAQSRSLPLRCSTHLDRLFQEHSSPTLRPHEDLRQFRSRARTTRQMPDTGYFMQDDTSWHAIAPARREYDAIRGARPVLVIGF